jgi:hypothetical protein
MIFVLTPNAVGRTSTAFSPAESELNSIFSHSHYHAWVATVLLESSIAMSRMVGCFVSDVLDILHHLLAIKHGSSLF